MGQFILGLARHFGLSRIHTVGPDVGTSALLFAAASRPDLFESIAVGSGGASMDLVGDILREIIASPFGQIDGGRDGEHVVESIKLLAKPVPPDDILEDYRLTSAGGRYKAASAYVRAYRTIFRRTPMQR